MKQQPPRLGHWFLLLAACSAPAAPPPEPSPSADAAADAAPDAPVAEAAASDAADASPYAPDLPAIQPIPDLTAWVDPRIGTAGSGNVFMGATLPHGMVKLGPDTDNGTQDIRGYQWNATKIQAFSHTHLDGPGGSAYGYSQIALLPTMGTRTFDEDKYAATFTHDGEIAEPARYAVTLTAHNIRAELTADRHCGWHRYTFPAGTARVLVDLGHSRGKSLGGHVQVSGADVAARADYNVDPAISGLLQEKTPAVGLSTVYAAIHFDRPPAKSGVWQARQAAPGQEADGAEIGAWLEWESAAQQTVAAQVCISFLDAPTALGHLQVQSATQLTFEQVHAAAKAEWNALLGRVLVETASDTDRTRFYTALFHALLQPADYTENGKFFNGSKAIGAVQSTAGRQFYTDDWCVWDTTRTTHPLLTLIQPEVVADMLQSLLWLVGPEGYLPKCPWQASGDSRVMTGNFTFCVLADAAVKGLGTFDTAAALQVMEHGAMTDSVNPGDDGLCGYLNQGSPPFYVQNGWVPAECDFLQGASMTLEHAYSDWCLGQFAAVVGNPTLATAMKARGQNWRNTWGPHTFPQLRNADGSWHEPFDPKASTGFTEATAWIYQWLVPQDRCGLVAQLGGKTAALQRLDAFFDGGHFDMGNEPDFHAPWLYADAGRPDLASARVHALMAAHFKATPDGLPGNDDAGAMSAWLVFAALGLYPVAPGDGMYALTAPLFARSDIHVGPSTVRVEAEGVGSGHAIVAAKWNGVALVEPRIAHSELVRGGFLELTIGPTSSGWGEGSACP